jgi:hypothetical protein
LWSWWDWCSGMVGLNFEGVVRIETVVPSGVDSPVHGILYGIRSDLTYMKREELRRDQYTALVQTVLVFLGSLVS